MSSIALKKKKKVLVLTSESSFLLLIQKVLLYGVLHWIEDNLAMLNEMLWKLTPIFISFLRKEYTDRKVVSL